MTSEAPPSYSDATKGKDAPPSYDQIFGVSEIKNAKNESSNKGVFAVKLCEILCGSVACMICVLILAALPVAMIVIGSVYLNDCPGRDKIPIWLIVFGCVSLLQTLINICKRCFKLLTKEGDNDRERSDRDRNYGSRGGNCLETFLSFFLFIWIIIGSVWVFGYWDFYRQSNKSAGCLNIGGDPYCCHPVPYLFSFITLIVIYAFSILVCCCCCCCFCFLALVAGASSDASDDD